MEEGYRTLGTEGLREKCGVVGIWLPEEESAAREMGVARLTYLALRGVQHRGYDGAGLYVIDPSHGVPFLGTKGEGKVDEALGAYSPECSTLDAMAPSARISVGQTRYGTNSLGGLESVQPFCQDEFVLAHNGHIEHVPGQREGQGDTEALAAELGRISIMPGDARAENADGIVRAIHELGPKLEGAFTLVAATRNQLIGVRDPQGYRPLMLGYLPDRGGFILASEEPALNNAGAKYVRDLLPGEVMTISDKGIDSTLLDRPMSSYGGLCILEYSYFARADSSLEGRDVYSVRKAFGIEMAREQKGDNVDMDIIVPVPESSRPAAYGYARESGLPLVGAIALNRDYNSRSFMASTPEGRSRAVSAKMQLMREELRGRRVGIVDDTVVRGTTFGVLVGLLRDAGAAEVHGLIAAAPIVKTCYQGIDIGRPEDLLARRAGSVDAMSKKLGLDSLRFLSVAGMLRAIESVPRRQVSDELLRLAPLPTRLSRPVSHCTTCMGGQRAIKIPGDDKTPLLPELKA